MSRRAAYPYVLWMALFVAVPLALVAVFSLTTDTGVFTLRYFLRLGEFSDVFARSMWLALIATVLCLLLGYPLAYALSRETPLLQKISMLLIMLPMWMNFLLRTYAWVTILDHNGLLDRLQLWLGAEKPLNIINTEAAVVLGMVYNYLPFMVLPIYTVIQKIDRSVIEAAQDLGGNSYVVFRRVIFPLSLPGILSGITMVFVPSVSTFVISKVLGGGKTLLLGDLIEMQFLGNAYNPHLGSAISLVMMLIVLASMYIMNRFGGGEEEVPLL